MSLGDFRGRGTYMLLMLQQLLDKLLAKNEMLQENQVKKMKMWMKEKMREEKAMAMDS